MIEALKFICKPFDELTLHELYAFLKLRQEVFIVEQNCPFTDADDRDQKGWHLMGYDTQNLVVYARILPKGVPYEGYVSIGRILSSPQARGKGYGKVLVQTAIQETYRLLGENDIKIGAQLYLQHFYESFGFESISEHYLEDGIPHLGMIKKIIPHSNNH